MRLYRSKYGLRAGLAGVFGCALVLGSSQFPINATTGGAYNPSLHSEAAEVRRRLGVAPARPAEDP